MAFIVEDRGLIFRTKLFWSFVAIATEWEKAEGLAFNALSTDMKIILKWLQQEAVSFLMFYRRIED